MLLSCLDLQRSVFHSVLTPEPPAAVAWHPVLVCHYDFPSQSGRHPAGPTVGLVIDILNRICTLYISSHTLGYIVD